MSNVSGWLPNLLGPVELQDNGTVVTPRGAINFIGFTAVDNEADDSTDLFAPGAVVDPRSTALDVNHLHAWELNDASGDFVDTGNSTAKVNLTASGSPMYGTPGLFGICPFFGLDAAGAINSAKGSASSSAFSDLPLGACSIECWYRSYSNGLGYLCGFDYVGSGAFYLTGGGSANGVLSAAAYGNAFKSMTSNARVNAAGPVWHHVLLSYGAGVHFMYLDGEIIGTATGQTGSIVWTYGTTPGMSIAKTSNNPATDIFIGQMSRVRLSNIARSQAYCRSVYRKAMGL